MRVGYLHIGPPDHGVYRLGVILAAEARKRESLWVVEATATLTGDSSADRAKVVAAARLLADTDVVHLQYNAQREKSVWGQGWRQWFHLVLFAWVCRRPFVVQVCDFYPRSTPRELCAQAPAQLAGAAVALWRRLAGTPTSTRRTRPRFGAFVKEIKSTFGPVGFAVRWLARHASALLVCAEEEERRLRAFAPRGHIRRIPLFVEERTLPADARAAKARVGLSGRTVLTLLGYVHPRKGHQLLLEALALLPDDYFVVFAGQAREAQTRQAVLDRARACGVASRMRLTGYLSEDELNDYLAATDLAVCPFQTVAGSSSLSTWISAVRPILASDLPLIEEYNRVAPGAIRVFSPYTAEALARAIRDVLATADAGVPGILSLREAFAVSSIFDEYQGAYRRALPNGGVSEFRARRVPGSVP